MSQDNDSDDRMISAILERQSDGRYLITGFDSSPSFPEPDPEQPPSSGHRGEAGFSMYDLLLVFLIALAVWFTANYIFVNYYQNRPDYLTQTPEWAHVRRQAFRTGLDLRVSPNDSAPAVISIGREEPVELLQRSHLDRFGNVWYYVRYHQGGRSYDGWVPAPYLH